MPCPYSGFFGRSLDFNPSSVQKIENNGGFYYAPTILAVEDQKVEIIQKEVFGPVVTIQKFTTEEEALSMANDVIYGLASSVWTNDAKRSMRLSRALQFGTVWVNAYEITTNERPWGGYKQSGYGKDLSKYSLEDYTQIKNVVVGFEYRGVLGKSVNWLPL